MNWRRLRAWHALLVLLVAAPCLAQDVKQPPKSEVTWADRVVECGGMRPTGDGIAAMAALALSGKMRESELCLDGAAVTIAIHHSKAQAIPFFARLLKQYPQTRENWDDTFTHLMSPNAEELIALAKLVPDFSSQAAVHLGIPKNGNKILHANFCRWTTLSSMDSFAEAYCWPGGWVTYFSTDTSYCVHARDWLYDNISSSTSSEVLLADALSQASCKDSVSSKYHSVMRAQLYHRENIRWLHDRAESSGELAAWFKEHPEDAASVYWFRSDCESIVAIDQAAQMDFCSRDEGQLACTHAIICATFTENSRLSAALIASQRMIDKPFNLTPTALRYASTPKTNSETRARRASVFWIYLPLFLMHVFQ